jgi:hypothetical protein
VRKPYGILPHHTLLDRLASLVALSSAGNPASAEGANIAWAAWKRRKAENVSFPLDREMESQVR